MNVNNNHLYDLGKLSEQFKDQLWADKNVKPVPEELWDEATDQLNGEAQVKVPANTSLARWARKVRKNLNQNP